MPLDHDSRPDVNEPAHADAGPGVGRVFKGSGDPARLAALVFPRDLCNRPYRLSRFDTAPDHAIVIGETE